MDFNNIQQRNIPLGAAQTAKCHVLKGTLGQYCKPVLSSLTEDCQLSFTFAMSCWRQNNQIISSLLKCTTETTGFGGRPKRLKNTLGEDMHGLSMCTLLRCIYTLQFCSSSRPLEATALSEYHQHNVEEAKKYHLSYGSTCHVRDL